MIQKLFTSFFFYLLSNAAIATSGVWACQPTHWVNLRADGPSINEGEEPLFVLTFDEGEDMIRTSGKGSWLNDGEFRIRKRLDFDGIIYYFGISEWGSQISFSPTNKAFFHSSTSSGISVSMTATCNSG